MRETSLLQEYQNDRSEFLEVDDDEEPDSSIVHNNLDKFFQILYSYYAERGFWPMVVSRLSNVLIIAFTMVFSTFLLLFVNWSELLKCNSEEACQNNPGMRKIHGSFYDLLIIFYTIVFCLYLLWNIYIFTMDYNEIRDVSTFYKKTLQFEDHDLTVRGWFEIVDKLISVQDQVRLFHGRKLSALDVTNRIMRKDNYLLAMVNAEILDLSSPCGFSDYYSLMHRFERTESHNVKAYMGIVLEYNIRRSILDWMFDDNFTIRDEFRNVEKLKQRFLVMGLINLFFMPFALLFRFIFFFLTYGEQLQTKSQSFSLREWTPYAKLVMREFNEMPHEFNQRLRLTYPHANDYLTHSEWVLSNIVGRFLAYVSGSVVGVLALITVLDSNVLLYYELWGRGLVWYLAIFSTLLLVSRNLVQDTLPKTKDAHEAMKNLHSYAHYLPKRWIVNAHQAAVQEEFQSLYQSTLMIVVHEIFNVIFTPFILLLTLPSCADKIVKFVLESTVTLPGVGDVCKYAMLNPDEGGDSRYAPPGSKQDQLQDTPLRDGKLEKSLITFAMNHPRWQTDPLQTDLLQSVVDVTTDKKDVHFDNQDNDPDLLVQNSIQHSAFGHKSRVEDNPMNMSFSTLLGPFNQRRQMGESAQESFLKSDYQGINLLEGSFHNNLRDYTSRVHERHAQMFANLESRSPQKRIPHSSALRSIQEDEEEEVEILPPSEHHKPLGDEPEVQRQVVNFRPSSDKFQPLLKVQQDEPRLGVEEIDAFPDGNLQEEDFQQIEKAESPEDDLLFATVPVQTDEFIPPMDTFENRPPAGFLDSDSDLDEI